MSKKILALLAVLFISACSNTGVKPPEDMSEDECAMRTYASFKKAVQPRLDILFERLNTTLNFEDRHRAYDFVNSSNQMVLEASYKACENPETWEYVVDGIIDAYVANVITPLYDLVVASETSE